MAGDWDFLERFEMDLTTISVQGNPAAIKSELAALGYGNVDVPVDHGGAGRSPLMQMLMQFICGYHDLDLRDVAHAAHGRMVLLHGSDSRRKRWSEKIIAGGLVAICATEKRGGTMLQAITTRAQRSDTSWLLSGEKSWISRIEEACVMIVFFKAAGDHRVSAAVVDAQSPGINREKILPYGLSGWSWGHLRFENTPIYDEGFLGKQGAGLDIFRDHFAYYRPMVAATALGAAAAVFDAIVASITQRIAHGMIDRCRDSALEVLGRNFVAIQSDLLLVLTAQQLVAAKSPAAGLWSRLSKAHGVDTAYRVVSEISPLAGAASFQETNKISKVHRDLRGLLYADGIHDALLRSGGLLLLTDAS